MRTISFNDEKAMAPLVQLEMLILTLLFIERGMLSVDFPEKIKLPILPEQYQTISLLGATVNLGYCWD